MLGALDAHYREAEAVAACVLFREWSDSVPTEQLVELCEGVEPYRPGALYRRELPCLLRCLARIDAPLEALIVDGYVWLNSGAPALGGHLYRALGEKVPVIGIAKNPFARAGASVEITRGRSRRPLLISAAGIELATAAEHVRAMHGPHRIPTLLKAVDLLARAGG